MRKFRTALASVMMLALAFSLVGEAFARSPGGGRGMGGGGSGGGFKAPSSSPSPAPASRDRGFSAPSSTPKASPPPATYTTPKPTPVERAAPPPVQRTAPAYDEDAERARREEASRRRFQESQQREAERRREEERRKSPSTATTPTSPSPQGPTTAGRTSVPPTSTTPPPTTTASQPPRTDPPRDPYREPPRTRTVYVERSSGSDPVNMWFWVWFLENQRNERTRAENDRWVYNHRDRLSPEQMDELRRRDADLERRLRELEARGTPRDPDYRHRQADERQAGPPRTVPPPVVESRTEGSSFWLWMGGAILLLVGVYFAFFHKFEGLRRSA